jgi:hypothetical protein
MTDPPDPEDDGLNVVRRDEPKERLLRDVVPDAEDQQSEQELRTSDGARYSSISLLTFLGGFVFVVLALLAGYIYLIQPGPRRHWATLGDQAPAVTPSPIAPIKRLPTPPPFPDGVTLKTGLPITADMLHVTSIALGDIHLAIVNGKRLAEGDWLRVRVGKDTGAVQVTKIEDGVVHFNYGGRTIDAKLIMPPKQQAPR